MRLIIILFGTLLVLAGISLLYAPEIIFGFIDNYKGDLLLYISAIAIRLVLGIMLILSASASKFPLTMKIMGALFIAVAAIFIIIGREGLQELISSLLPVLMPYSSLGGLVAIALGSFFIYAFTAKK